MFKTKISNNSTPSLNSELKICIFGAYDPLYDTVCSINRELRSSHIININNDIYRTGFFGKLKNFVSALLHTTVLFSVHYGPSQIYSLILHVPIA